MSVVFRTDASRQLGAGHLMRCLALADSLRARGAEPHFISRRAEGDLHGLVRERGLRLTALPAADATGPPTLPGDDLEATDARSTLAALATMAAPGGKRPDWLLVDHYALGRRWEQAMRPAVARLAVIDDLPQRPHDADLLLDQNLPLQDAPAAVNRAPPACQSLIGPRFALLRPEFAALRAHRPARLGNLKRVLVFFSGGDDLGETLKALQGLVLARTQGLLQVGVDAVMGEGNPDREAIAALCLAQGWTAHCQTPHMAALVAAADLAIGAGGSSSWERCVLGLPALLTVLADNQQGVALALHQAGAARCLGWGANLQAADYAAALAALHPALLGDMARRAAALVDGLGSDRVAQALLAAAA